jgi:hypothetical protein
MNELINVCLMNNGKFEVTNRSDLDFETKEFDELGRACAYANVIDRAIREDNKGY